ALHRLGVLAAGFAQMGVQVDQSGQHDQSIGIDDLRAAGTGVLAGGDHDPGADQQIGRFGSDDGSALDQVRGHFCPPSIRYSTAIRPLTPLAPCPTIVERGESATSGVISIPRFIGPGCMTIACPGSIRIRAASSPYRREYSRTDGKYASSIRSRCTR